MGGGDEKNPEKPAAEIFNCAARSLLPPSYGPAPASLKGVSECAGPGEVAGQGYREKCAKPFNVRLHFVVMRWFGTLWT